MSSQTNLDNVTVRDRYVGGASVDTNPQSPATGGSGSVSVGSVVGLRAELDGLEAVDTALDARLDALESISLYTVLLTQAGTGDPSEVVLNNDLGSAVWSRTSQGRYRLTATGQLTANKVWAQEVWAGNALLTWDLAGVPDYVELVSELGYDDELTGTALELRVYP